MSRRVAIVGAGDHGRVIAELVSALRWGAVIIEPRAADDVPQTSPPPLSVDGSLENPEAWRDRIDGFVVALGDNRRRSEVWERCLALGLAPITLVHPRAIVLGGARLEDGAQVCAAAVVGSDARVAGNAIVNTGATVDHDVVVESHAFVGPGCHLAGRVTVAEGAFLGTGAVVIPGRRIGAWAVVGAGAAVIEDVVDGARVAGVPARRIP